MPRKAKRKNPMGLQDWLLRALVDDPSHVYATPKVRLAIQAYYKIRISRGFHCDCSHPFCNYRSYACLESQTIAFDVVRIQQFPEFL